MPTASLAKALVRAGVDPRDLAAMVNHSIPTAGPYAAASAGFLAAAPFMYLIAGQAASVGQDRLVGLLDTAINWGSYVADAVNSDGSLRKDAPFTVVRAKLSEAELAERERELAEEGQQGKKKSDEDGEEGASSSSPKPASPKAAAFATAASDLLEAARDTIHAASQKRRGRVRHLVGRLAMLLWLRVARVLATTAAHRASKVILAYAVCGALDVARARTVLGRLLFFKNAVAVGGLSDALRQQQQQPFLLSSSFRFVCLAFLSEASAVMNIFANVCVRDDISASSSPQHIGTINRLLSRYAFFYDSPAVHFKSSAHALGSLVGFQYLPFVFGHRHLTGVGPLENVAKKAALTRLGPVELCYWVFLKDAMRISHEVFWELIVAALSSSSSSSSTGSRKRDQQRNRKRKEEEQSSPAGEEETVNSNSAAASPDAGDVGESHTPASRAAATLRRCEAAFLVYIAKAAAYHGFRTASQQREAETALEANLDAEEAAFEKKKRALTTLSTDSSENLAPTSPSIASVNGGGADGSVTSSGTAPYVSPTSVSKKKKTSPSSAVEELSDDDERDAPKEKGIAGDAPATTSTSATGQEEPNDESKKKTDSDETEKAIAALRSSTDAAKERLLVAFAAGEALRPSSRRRALLKALVFYCSKYAASFTILSFAHRTLGGVYNAETGRAVIPPTSLTSSSSLAEVAYNKAVLRPAAKLHNFLCGTLFDGRKGVPFLWHASVFPIFMMIAPMLVRMIVKAVVRARLRKAKRSAAGAESI